MGGTLYLQILWKSGFICKKKNKKELADDPIAYAEYHAWGVMGNYGKQERTEVCKSNLVLWL